MTKPDLTLDYENAAFIPGGADYPEKWELAAESWRITEHSLGRARLNVAYGTDERQALDLFVPAGRLNGLVVFVHGGYWLRFDRKYWSHLAHGCTSRGWAIAMPSYRLAPTVRISKIVRDASTAIDHAANLVAGPIRLAGHSAGGHLVARMNCADTDLQEATLKRIERIVSISPVSDLRPLLQTAMNETLHLDESEAEAQSPRLTTARHGLATQVWVGAEERPVFLDQARWLADAWDEAELRIAAGRHHFDIVEELADPESPLLAGLLG